MLFNSARQKDYALTSKALNKISINPYTDKPTAEATPDLDSHRKMSTIGVDYLDVRATIKSKDAKGRSVFAQKKGYKMIARKLKIDDVKKLQQGGNLNDEYI